MTSNFCSADHVVVVFVDVDVDVGVIVAGLVLLQLLELLSIQVAKVGLSVISADGDNADVAVGADDAAEMACTTCSALV